MSILDSVYLEIANKIFENVEARMLVFETKMLKKLSDTSEKQVKSATAKKIGKEVVAELSDRMDKWVYLVRDYQKDLSKFERCKGVIKCCNCEHQFKVVIEIINRLRAEDSYLHDTIHKVLEMQSQLLDQLKK